MYVRSNAGRNSRAAPVLCFQGGIPHHPGWLIIFVFCSTTVLLQCTTKWERSIRQTRDLHDSISPTPNYSTGRSIPALEWHTTHGKAAKVKCTHNLLVDAEAEPRLLNTNLAWEKTKIHMTPRPPTTPVLILLQASRNTMRHGHSKLNRECFIIISPPLRGIFRGFSCYPPPLPVI